MIRSMTGYSRKECVIHGYRVVVEMRSVNHRFCEITTHLPTTLSQYDLKIKRIIGQCVSRGKVDAFISLRPGLREQRVCLDEAVARQYVSALKKLQRDLHLAGNIDIGLLASFKELTTFASPPIPPVVVRKIIDHVLPSALKTLNRMRQREGHALTRDIMRHIRQVRRNVATIKRRAPNVVQHYIQRLHERVVHVTKDCTADDARIAQEIALFAARCDISEELTRTASHLNQCQALMETGGEVGRTMNFLMQELNREVNTIGAKGNDLDVSQQTIAIKGSLEKIREQLQNIE